jgi:hypothetical protein
MARKIALAFAQALARRKLPPLMPLPRIITQHQRLILLLRLQMHPPTPQPMHMLQRLRRVRQVQTLPIEIVPQIQLPVAVVVAIGHHDLRPAAIGQHRHQHVADLLVILLHHHQLVAALLVEIEIEVVHRLLRQIVADQRHVALLLAQLEHDRRHIGLVATVPPVDLLQQSVTQVVGVQRPLRRLQHARMQVGEVHVLLVRQPQRPQQPQMPEDRPALVDDLRLPLRQEIEHLVAHDRDDIPLPVLQHRRIAEDEEQQIAERLPCGRRDRRRRRPGLGPRRATLQIPQIVERPGRRRTPQLLRLLRAAVGRRVGVGVDVLLDRQRRVEQPLHRTLPEAVLVPSDPLGVAVHRLHHLARGLGEVDVVGEEVGMPQHMRRHELILQQRIHVEQIGIARVGVDHQLVNLAHAIVVHRLHLLERPPVRPVAEAPRHAIRPELVHDRGRHHLEMRRERPQPMLVRQLPQPLDRLTELIHVALIDHDGLRAVPSSRFKVQSSKFKVGDEKP